MAKVKKHDTFIDMTAMSDVTVLLLTFFMLTATFKQPEPVEVLTPASVSETKVPDYDVLTILVDTEGRVFLNMDDKDKVPVLSMMAEQYGVKLDRTQIHRFMETTHIGAPMNMMSGLLSKHGKDQAEIIKKLGVPVDSANNQLEDWVRCYKKVNENSSIAIKSDRLTPYPLVDKVMKTLVDMKENRYSLVTTLRAMPEGL